MFSGQMLVNKKYKASKCGTMFDSSGYTCKISQVNCIISVGRSARSVASSLRSGEIVLPGEEVYGKYDDAIAAIDGDLENVETAMGEQAKVARMEDGRRSGAMSEAVS